MEVRSDATTPQPATFRERGVAVPFTTPGLQVARVRQGKAEGGKGGLELVFPNPSGGRGTYVVPWAGVADLCQPTLHDLYLLVALEQSFTRGVPVSPLAVQAAARRVALGGAAGRPARAATAAADAADLARLQATTRHLLTALVAEGGADPVRGPDMAEMTAVARIMAPLGIGPGADDAPVPQAIHDLQALRDGLLAWAALQPEGERLARLAATLAGEAAQATALTLRAARQGPGVAALVRAWRLGPDTVAALASRPAWLLDGWRLPCLIWQQAPGSPAAVQEVAHLAPALAGEAAAWTGSLPDPAVPLALRRLLATEARNVVNPDLVARNEHLRALAA
jgi:hypothetical protein